MNIKAHYESYKESFGRTYLEGYPDFAATLPPPEYGSSNLSDHLKTLATTMENSALYNDHTFYWTAIKQHQALMLQVFDKMVINKLRELNITVTDSIAITEYMLLIKRCGWKYFRYSRCPGLTVAFIDDVIPPAEFIPRYSSPYLSKIESVNYFDAEEAMNLGVDPVPSDMIQKYMNKKPPVTQGLYKFFPGAGELMLVSEPREVVQDWTLSLDAISYSSKVYGAI